MGNEIDGKFTIAKGQGITQGIVKELNLSDEQCKKIKYSVWEKVMKEVDKQKETTNDLYKGGNDLKGKYSENYVVDVNQKIDLSAVWAKIVALIQEAIGETIGQTTDDKTNEAPKDDKEADIPKKEVTPPAQDKQGAEKLKNEPKDTTNAGKTVTKDGVERQYDDKGALVNKKDSSTKIEQAIVRDSDSNILRYTEKTYNDKNKVSQECKRDKDGNVTKFFDYEYNENDKPSLVTERDKDGNLTSYTRYEYDADGKNTREIEYYPIGRVKCYTEYEYGENGKPKQRVVKSPDGTITDIYEYQYDENGKKTGEIHKDKDGKVIEE